MERSRDCILLVGVISTGKTTATETLIGYLSQRHIPVAQKPVSDAVHILTALSEDDRGLHHAHPWQAEGGAHTHRAGEPDLPFMVTDNVIPDRMLQLLFMQLASMPNTGEYHVVEWAGGTNVLPKDNPLSSVDFSYGKGKRMLLSGEYPGVLDRIALVIDITADDAVRHAFNAKTVEPDLSAAKSGVGWRRQATTFDFFGRDDFVSSGLADEFAGRDVPVVRIKNEGTDAFYSDLRRAAGPLIR